MTRHKAWVGLVGSLASAIGVALSDNIFDADDATQVSIAVIGALSTMYGVWKVRNRSIGEVPNGD